MEVADEHLLPLYIIRGDAILAVVLKISDRLNKYLEMVLFSMIVAMAVIITLQVVFRFFFTALSWSEEASRFLLVWSSMIGASVGFKRGAHISITFVTNLLPQKAKKPISVVSYVIQAIFFWIVTYYGVILINDQGFQTSPAMGIHMSYVYMVYPMVAPIILVHLIAGIIKVVNE